MLNRRANGPAATREMMVTHRLDKTRSSLFVDVELRLGSSQSPVGPVHDGTKPVVVDRMEVVYYQREMISAFVFLFSFLSFLSFLSIDLSIYVLFDMTWIY